MPNPELVKEILTQIDTAIKTIQFRFEPVDSMDYLLDTPQRQEGDFEIIKPKFKNVIDILIYDDLLKRLENTIEIFRR